MTTTGAAWHKGFKDPVSGLTHFGGFLASLFAGGILIGATQGATKEHLVSLVFVTSSALLYLASATYHLVVTSAENEKRLRVFDHAAIFVMIAGTSTPYFYYGYDEPTRSLMLTLVWALAVTGVAFKLLWWSAPRWLYVVIYVAMGWIALLRWQETVDGLSATPFAFLVGGGVAYTVGAIVYALKRPNFGQLFGFHEIWHLFVLAGTALHYGGIYALSVAG